MTLSTILPAIDFLRERLTRAPRAVLILGSGLGGAASEVRDALRISYSEIPGFPGSTVVGHAGALVTGILEGVEVAVMQGRFHLYEGWGPETVALPLRVLAALGADHLVVTNAAGGIRPGFRPGDLMLIADHINLMFRSPLMGPVPPGGDRFPDMSDPYDPELREMAMEVARELKMPLVQGVYAGLLGPSFETPAEVRMLQRLGADAVGMSTVPEVLVARALGMRVTGFSCITNVAAGLGPHKLSHQEVLEVGLEAGQRLGRLIRTFIGRALPRNLSTEAAS